MTAKNFFGKMTYKDFWTNDYFFKQSSICLFGEMTPLIFRGNAATPFLRLLVHCVRNGQMAKKKAWIKFKRFKMGEIRFAISVETFIE